MILLNCLNYHDITELFKLPWYYWIGLELVRTVQGGEALHIYTHVIHSVYDGLT